MSLDRRVLLTGSASLLLGGAAVLAGPAAAQTPAAPAADNPRLSERAMGEASAPMVVQEFFYLEPYGLSIARVGTLSEDGSMIIWSDGFPPWVRCAVDAYRCAWRDSAWLHATGLDLT